ncbi:TonB-dependent receptor [Shewanella sp. 10N.286.51.B2]|uniref:TonB-dependent receptor n=1 Tax=unclassified Shewanella TaxID=196818 RepID=UPI0026E38AEF|nr:MULTISPECIES: TonB-dependent receptor [unclassified Shewanella]MDO6617804.1 TonB-dependent receptor [Shewanella sp. 6_MG-2023]MDO6774850.1 TonB-dependent receptor [Shewanella sp. 3_MG-2023]
MHKNLLAKSVRLAMISGAAAAALSSPVAFAAEEGEKVERIQVTGSAIKRTDMEGSLPVTVLTAEDIARTGVDNVADLMQQLPAMQGFTTTSDSVGGSGGGTSTASIHDLGEAYTLVLLNGRRMAPRGSGSTIDLNSIPLSAIARVDVLTDGASALYGSDAIAGVVNFVLKDNVNETTITGRYSLPEEDGGSGWNGSITTGFGDIDTDGFNVMLSYSHDSKEQLKATDRDFAKTGMIEFESKGKDLFFFNGSPNAIPGNGRFYFADGTTQDFNPNRNETGVCAENTSSIGDWCWFDYTTTIEIQPESERDSFLLKADFAITDNLTGFVEGTYSDYSMTTRIAPYPSGGVLISTDSPLFDQYFTPNLPAGYNPEDVDFGLGVWRALPAGNRTTEWNTKSTHLVAGLEGTIGDNIDFDAAYTYSVNDTDQNYPTGWLIESKFVDAVESGAIDIFAPAGTVTQEEVDAAGIVYSGDWSNSKTVMNALDFKLSMPVFEVNGNDAYFAAGADYRTYDYDYSLSDANQESILLFLSADQPYSMSREVYGAFAELNVPLTDTFDITGSLRYDNIGAVDDNLNGGTINDSDDDVTYKLSGRWQATEDLLIRASYGTGFKAPSMLAIGQPRAEAGVTGGNYQCPFEGTGDAKEAWCKPGSQQYNVFSQGNPGLKSETSSQYSAGFVYAPSNQFSFGLDYWAVEMEDVVTSLTEAQIFAEPEKYYDLFTYKTNTATGIDELAILQANVNVGKSKNSGLDWHFNSATDLSYGTVHFGLTGTYTIESEYTRPGTTDDYISSLGKFGDNNAVTFRVVSQLQAGYEHDDFYHNFTFNYRSGYLDQFQSKEVCSVTENDAFGDCQDVQLSVGSYTKLDYQSRWNITDHASVVFGINNLLDKQPSLSLRSGGAGHQVGYDPRYTDSYGRTYYLSGSYAF